MSENMIACNLSFDDINKLADKVENGKLSKIKIKNGDCEIVIEKECKIAAVPAVAQTAAPIPQPETAPQPAPMPQPAPVIAEAPVQEPANSSFVFCSQCGHKEPAGVKFCSECGMKL